MINVTNSEFLQAIFGEDQPWVHVTDFSYDPGAIPEGRHLHAWKGDFFSRYHIQQGTNQYFTISCFYTDDQGQARRRKALYRHTPVVVLDDVKEKLSMDEVSKLPKPAWILETSQGSEQWGYILNEPCTDRHRVENLLDGLVANGLAPDGKDPGMKGVTRYVRLPEGYNTKQKKMINGQPFKCQMLVWEPGNRVTLDELATPFHVNLDAQRREARVDGAADISDHPLVNIHDVIHIKEVRSAGRFDITCPWVDEHTNADDSGAAIFTNADHTIGFKCHHGACQHRTGRDLLKYIEQQVPGFGADFANWKVLKSFTDIVQPVDFMGSDPMPMQVDFMGSDPTPAAVPTAPTMAPASVVNGFDAVIGELRRHPPSSSEARSISSELLKQVEELPTMDKVHWHTEIRDIMRWSKPELNEILKDLRSTWYNNKTADISFFDSVVYVGELNQFFDRSKQIFYSAEAYQNTYAHLDAEARKEALQGGRVVKVDKIDYAPKMPAVFEERGITYANTWSNVNEPSGQIGDISPWVNHFDVLGWGDYREHIMQWMAYTIRHPDMKINHMIIMGSGEGCGKDWLLTPLTKAMEGHERTIQGDELLSNFNDYLMSVKYLNINETELGDRREAKAVSNKMKPLAAAPPLKMTVNPKGVKAIQIRNIVNCTMTTNSQLPLQLNSASRRFLALWSDLNPRDEDEQMLPEWVEYWKQMWHWMNNGGADYVIYYLRNHVDLSTFNPQSAPPVTQFLRDIRESSKSPAEQTLEGFIRERVGMFQSDIMSAQDISTTIRAGSLIAPHLMFCEERVFTPVLVGRLMKQLNGTVQLRGSHSGGKSTMRLWVVRDRVKYEAMSPADLYREYERQLMIVKNSKPLTVVN